jgi:DNA polymerase-4
LGVKTGTGVLDAKRLCPEIRIVVARPELYVRFHHRIIAAVESCLHVDAVLSIDEMNCRLLGTERLVDNAIALGRKVKQRICADVGACLRCSVGIAPNRFLAKVASDMQKPDGLTVIQLQDLPHALYTLDLEDLPGIGGRMHAHLLQANVDTVEKLCALSEPQLAHIWHSVLGTHWYHNLRGHEVLQPPSSRKSIGHSHVLPPELRNHHAARAVLINLIHKAAFRLRHLGFWAGHLAVWVEHTGGSWCAKGALGGCQDTQTIIEVFDRLWRTYPPKKPYVVGITLYRLVHDTAVTLPLFPEDRLRTRLAKAMDSINERYGKNTVYFGEIHQVRHSAPTRISFTQIPDFTLPL